MGTHLDEIRSLLMLASGYPAEALPDVWRQALTILTGPDTRYWNRLIIPIYENLKSNRLFEQVADDIHAVLQKKFMELLTMQTIQQNWVERIVGLLVHNRIPAILLKGAACGGTLYDPAYSRLSQDIDVLVQRKDTTALFGLMSSIGQLKPPDPSRRFSAAHSHETTIPLNASMPFNLEVHTELHPRFSFHIDPRVLWETSTPHPHYRSDGIRMLAPELQLVYLATHSFFHLEYEPHHLVDACRLIRTFRPDIDRAVRYAREWGCLTILTTLFMQLEFWFGISNPLRLSVVQRWKIKRIGDRFRNPAIPSTHDVRFVDQIRSMILHDRYCRVVYFAAWYVFKQVMDRVMIGRINRKGRIDV